MLPALRALPVLPVLQACQAQELLPEPEPQPERVPERVQVPVSSLRVCRSQPLQMKMLRRKAVIK